jgi:uncharacterized protein YggE
MKTLVLALLVTGLIAATAQSAQAEGRRMMIFAIYGGAGSTSATATTTVVDFTTQVACREAREALAHDRNMKAPGFHVFATCVEP